MTRTKIVKEVRKNSRYVNFKTQFPKQEADLLKLQGGEILEWTQYGDAYLVKVIK